MRITHLFTSAVLFFLFSSPALAQQEPKDDQPIVVKPNPALADVNRLIVVIIPSPSEPNTDGLIWYQLTETIESKIRKSGINIVADIAGNILEIPELRLFIDILKISDSQRCVIRVQTSFAEKVLIKENPNIYIKADVFRTDSVIREVSVQDMPQAVINAVDQQTDAFITARSAAKSAEEKADVNQLRQQLRKVTVEKDTKPAKQQAVESQYISSRNSQIFHKANCSSAKRISANNLVSYATRDEAVTAGKRPCERCNP
jgi:hypothetical protein